MRHIGKRPGSSKLRAFTFPTLTGFDEESESEEENSEEDEESEESEEEESESEEESEEEDEDDGKKNAAGLKSALQKERDARKKLEKEMKELRKFKTDKENENKSETQKAKDRADQAEKALEEATEALRNTQLDFEISSAARKARFRDIDDALRLVDRDEIEFDEDGKFDKKAVEKAVKAVKESKPHLVLSDGESAPSGSKFGGKKKNDKKATEKKLKEKYPALGR